MLFHEPRFFITRRPLIFRINTLYLIVYFHVSDFIIIKTEEYLNNQQYEINISAQERYILELIVLLSSCRNHFISQNKIPIFDNISWWSFTQFCLVFSFTIGTVSAVSLIKVSKNILKLYELFLDDQLRNEIYKKMIFEFNPTEGDADISVCCEVTLDIYRVMQRGCFLTQWFVFSISQSWRKGENIETDYIITKVIH